MNHFLSDRINNMATSATLAMAAKTRELKAQGRDIIGLSLGDQILMFLILLKRLPLKQFTIIIAATPLWMDMRT